MNKAIYCSGGGLSCALHTGHCSIWKSHIHQCSEPACLQYIVGCSSVIYCRAQHRFDMKQLDSLEAADEGGKGKYGWELGRAVAQSQLSNFIRTHSGAHS